jgi:hypothetical protein
MFRYIFIILFSIICFACQNKSNKLEKEASVVATQSLDKSPIGPLPSITREAMDTMYGMVDYVDYIWHDMDISTSQDNQDDIKAVVALISTTPQPSIPDGCKPTGRAFFNIKGNTFLEADIYFTNACKFFVFIKKGKPIYANLMTQDAITYFNAIMQAGKKPLVK